MADEDLVERLEHLDMSPRPRKLTNTKSTNLLEIDGRTLEGGGQLLRLSLTLFALTSRPVHISNIRGKRKPKPGLKAQHLACVQWLARACNATVIGAEKGSTDLVFTPGKVNGNSPVYAKSTTTGVWESEVAIGTAGSTGLLLQAILPFILFSPPRNETGEAETASDSTACLYILITATVTPSPLPGSAKPTPAPYILATDHLPERKTPPARSSKFVIDAATRCVNELCALWTSGARADEHLGDQLVVFQALAEGRSEVFGGDGREISLHARTAEWVAKEVLGVRCRDDGIEGIGFEGTRFDS
ncbi:hypothetical protein B0A48_11761 [Cryoendolithus antarcticus]|uniref:RNA 3'-terminal phosphate cyclase domain-containing protein n=1 Tax=Cryoendolithus antarcticus TaxID=1507870 RepID=A0A1V8SSN8_9PEZI|nr:hypothetical protein B0A48_11761 [Cryoendolithus antarcticus]